MRVSNEHLKKKKLLVYHGTNVNFDKPIINRNGKNLDFGYGFYVSFDMTQALNYAVTYKNNTESLPRCLAFTFNYKKAKQDANRGKLKILYFKYRDREWLEFIKNCRKDGSYSEGYDIIIGPLLKIKDENFHVRNSTTNFLDKYNIPNKHSRCSLDKFISMLEFNEYDKALKVVCDSELDQVVLCTNKALQYIERYREGDILVESKKEAEFLLKETWINLFSRKQIDEIDYFGRVIFSYTNTEFITRPRIKPQSIDLGDIKDYSFASKYFNFVDWMPSVLERLEYNYKWYEVNNDNREKEDIN